MERIETFLSFGFFSVFGLAFCCCLGHYAFSFVFVDIALFLLINSLLKQGGSVSYWNFYDVYPYFDSVFTRPMIYEIGVKYGHSGKVCKCRTEFMSKRLFNEIRPIDKSSAVPNRHYSHN